jgi:hypothetical protein
MQTGLEHPGKIYSYLQAGLTARFYFCVVILLNTDSRTGGDP